MNHVWGRRLLTGGELGAEFLWLVVGLDLGRERVTWGLGPASGTRGAGGCGPHPLDSRILWRTHSSQMAAEPGGSLESWLLCFPALWSPVLTSASVKQISGCVLTSLGGYETTQGSLLLLNACCAPALRELLYQARFSDGQTEARRTEVTCPRAREW